MIIRPYRHGDQAAVIALWQTCGLTRPWNDPERDIARKLALDDGLFLVGTLSGGAPEGPMSATADTDALIATVMVGYDGHRGWVNYLAVAPDQQGKGYGRVCMEEAETRLQALGCPKLNLQVRTGNEPVLAFYETLGYSVDDAISLGKRLIADD